MKAGKYRQTTKQRNNMNRNISKKEAASLSRVEHIREEMKRAAEYDQSPRKPLSLAQRFRVEAITKIPAPAVSEVLLPCGSRFPHAASAQGSVPRKSNPYHQMMSPEALSEAIASELRNTKCDVGEDKGKRLLSLFGDLAAQSPNIKKLSSLHKRVLSTVFGTNYFKNMQGGKASNKKQ